MGDVHTISHENLPIRFPQWNSKFKVNEDGEDDGQSQGLLSAEENAQDKTEITRKRTWKYTSGTGSNLVGIEEWSKDLV